MRRRVSHSSNATEEFVPVKDVSYLAVLVSRGIRTGLLGRKRRPLSAAHAHRIEQLMKQSVSFLDTEHEQQNSEAETIFGGLRDLANDLGISEMNEDREDFKY